MVNKTNIIVSLAIIASLIIFGVVSLVTKNYTMQNALLLTFVVEHIFVATHCVNRLKIKKENK